MRGKSAEHGFPQACPRSRPDARKRAMKGRYAPSRLPTTTVNPLGAGARGARSSDAYT